MGSSSLFRFSLSVACLLSVAADVRHVAAEDWPQFLGPSRNGVSSETGLPESLTETKVAWRVPGGVGMSGVSITAGKAITMWNEDDAQVLVALDAQTGAEIWKTEVSSNYQNGQGDGPRSTPTINNGVVYALTGDGYLCATSLDSGKLLWKTDAIGDAGAVSEYGMSSSPLVTNGQVIVHANTGKGTVLSLDAQTGKKRWAASAGPAGYASPMLLTVDGKPQVVALTGELVCGIDPKMGDVLWNYPFKTAYECNTASPISVEGGIFISAGENHGCVLLDVAASGNTFNVTERWSSIENKSVMRNEWQTSVLSDGYLYGFDNVGSAGPTTHLSCIKAATGESVWRKTRFGKGNLILADEKLWIITMRGELVLVKASPKSFQELGRKPLLAKTRQSLSIANGRGYIRDDREVVCVEFR